jgi:CDP-glucose 4,6-dehydratase
MASSQSFWQGKRVLVTGHTGFKGNWLTVFLHEWGAEVTGFSLPPEPSPLSKQQLESICTSLYGDIRDPQAVHALIQQVQPEIVLHMAAQPLVRYSYEHPVETYQTNVMGTLYLLEALRASPHTRVCLNVTTDKCYENHETQRAFRETDALGGLDPYSSSKACSELVSTAYRHSFFSESSALALATARAGNVIGGGDWSQDRIVSDIMRALLSQQPVSLRSPQAVRPWQFVLEPLHGYLMLAEKLWADKHTFASAWNFGPASESLQTVGWLNDHLQMLWQEKSLWKADLQPAPHEAHFLSLDSTKAHDALQWQPRLSLQEALHWVVDWYKSFEQKENMYEKTRAQVRAYQERVAS